MSKFKMSHTHTHIWNNTDNHTQPHLWRPSGEHKIVWWITHIRFCVCVWLHASVCVCVCICMFAPHASQWSFCASYLRVCVGAYMWWSLNHGSCLVCVCPFVRARSVLPIWLSACAVNHKTECVLVCVDGAVPDEVTGKGWPFGGPSLSPSYRLGINYSPSFNHTNWCTYMCFLFFAVLKCLQVPTAEASLELK